MATPTGVLRYGDQASRHMSERFGGTVASAVALAALPASQVVDGQLWFCRDSGWYEYNTTAAVGGIVCTATGSRFVTVGSASGSQTFGVRVATAAALPANTRTANNRTANANGALGNVDGVAVIVGDRILDKDQAATTQDRGIWVITSVGAGGAPWTMTRATDFDASAEVKGGALIGVSEGTVNGNKTFMLTTDDPIVLNTTGLTFVQLPAYTDLASTATGAGASLIGVEDAAGRLAGANVETALAELAAIRVFKVRAATIAALPANTRVGNVLTADANGALPAQDGIPLVVGNLLLVKDEATGEDHGIYSVTQVGDGGTPYILTRITAMNQDAEVTCGTVVVVEEGNLNPSSIWHLATPNPIVINVTVLAFVQTPNLVLLASNALGMGAALIGIQDPLTLITATTVEGGVAEIAGRRLQTRTQQITHTALTNAVNGGAEVENIGAALPAGARVVGVDVLLTTQFTGGGAAAVVVDVGVAGAVDALISDFDAFGSVAGAYYDRGAAGATRVRGNFAAAQLIATFTPDGAHNLDALTAGDLTVTVDFYLPGPA